VVRRRCKVLGALSDLEAAKYREFQEQPPFVMRRRRFLDVGLNAAAAAVLNGQSPVSVPERGGSALLMRLSDSRLVSVEGSEAARRWVLPPGSTIKPLTLLALIESGKLKKGDSFVCPRYLTIDRHNLTCSHPYSRYPMDVARTLAYSCNCAVVHFASRFAPGEFQRFLLGMGLGSETGLLSSSEAAGVVDFVQSPEASELQSLGEEHIAVTPLQLLRAYGRLAQPVNEGKLDEIREGLELAVEFGTAQQARLKNIRVAGKTGTVRVKDGPQTAWFAGFAPSRSPEVVAVALVQGRSGGADAAPVAHRLLSRYFGESS
jgi:penicillin-binding protein 2